MKNYAFIDSQNMYKSITGQGHQIDYRKFRLWLTNRYGITRAFMFFGFMEKRQGLYLYLRKCGFELIFRDVEYHLGKAKGNVDICLTIHVMDMLHENEFDKGFLITSDGDFFDLAERLKKESKLGGIISPQSKNHCSTLLKRSSGGRITYLPELMHIMVKK